MTGTFWNELQYYGLLRGLGRREHTLQHFVYFLSVTENDCSISEGVPAPGASKSRS